MLMEDIIFARIPQLLIAEFDRGVGRGVSVPRSRVVFAM